MERTTYMQQLMTETYPQVAMEAISGGFDGSWERCIAKQLEADVKVGKSQAIVIMESVENDSLKAAYLITKSQPIPTS